MNEISKIQIGHLEFEFNFIQYQILVRDFYSKIEYKLVPTGQHDIPFQIIKERHLT